MSDRRKLATTLSRRADIATRLEFVTLERVCRRLWAQNARVVIQSWRRAGRLHASVQGLNRDVGVLYKPRAARAEFRSRNKL